MKFNTDRSRELRLWTNVVIYAAACAVYVYGQCKMCDIHPLRAGKDKVKEIARKIKR